MYNTKLKKYTHNDSNIVSASKPMRLELGNAFIYFCYHPEKKKYIKINNPPSQHICTKYVTIPMNYHLLCKRDITVVAFLTPAAQRAKVANTMLKVVIKDAHTEEIVCTRIVEHRCYKDLVKIILENNNSNFRQQHTYH